MQIKSLGYREVTTCIRMGLANYQEELDPNAQKVPSPPKPKSTIFGQKVPLRKPIIFGSFSSKVIGNKLLNTIELFSLAYLQLDSL